MLAMVGMRILSQVNCARPGPARPGPARLTPSDPWELPNRRIAAARILPTRRVAKRARAMQRDSIGPGDGGRRSRRGKPPGRWRWSGARPCAGHAGAADSDGTDMRGQPALRACSDPGADGSEKGLKGKAIGGLTYSGSGERRGRRP